MTKRNFLTGLMAILLSISILSCSKDNGTPTIKFVPGNGFTGKDTIIKVNYILTVSLSLNWNGTDSLSKLDVSQNDIAVQSFPVNGDKADFNLKITKGTAQTEKWTFTVVDKKGNKSGISLTMTKDPNSEFGPIKYYSPIGLGAQNNTAKPGFFSLQTNGSATLYTLEQAFVTQAKIDLLFYSDLLTQSTLASPGSDIPVNIFSGPRDISKWTVKTKSVFQKSDMTALAFNSISNDAIIVSSWNDAASVLKADNLKVNDVWLVKLQSGKKGAILITRLVAGDAGEIEFDLKIQE